MWGIAGLDFKLALLIQPTIPAEVKHISFVSEDFFVKNPETELPSRRYADAQILSASMREIHRCHYLQPTWIR